MHGAVVHAPLELLHFDTRLMSVYSAYYAPSFAHGISKLLTLADIVNCKQWNSKHQTITLCKVISMHLCINVVGSRLVNENMQQQTRMQCLHWFRSQWQPNWTTNVLSKQTVCKFCICHSVCTAMPPCNRLYYVICNKFAISKYDDN